jgi:16S rRNA (guanine527-N7)-methyltransferase
LKNQPDPELVRAIDGPETFQAAFDVSRETMARLQIMHDLLGRWQKVTNLISRKSFTDCWLRHFADSAQLASLAGEAPVWVDLGSGAGFPGLVVALLREDVTMHLVESNGRKAAFLQTVCREAGIDAAIHYCRAEALDPGELGPPDVISARALAPLNKLMDLAHGLAGPYTQYIFPKGQHMVEEIEESTKYWTFAENQIKSLTDPQGRILMISGLVRKSQGPGKAEVV